MVNKSKYEGKGLPSSPSISLPPRGSHGDQAQWYLSAGLSEGALQGLPRGTRHGKAFTPSFSTGRGEFPLCAERPQPWGKRVAGRRVGEGAEV